MTALHKTWLWPDRTIGKKESRVLREEHNALVNSHEEHNALVNSHADLLAACESLVGQVNGLVLVNLPGAAQIGVRLAMSDARAAIAKARGDA